MESRLADSDMRSCYVHDCSGLGPPGRARNVPAHRSKVAWLAAMTPLTPSLAGAGIRGARDLPASQPFTQSTCFSSATISTRSLWYSITCSMGL